MAVRAALFCLLLTLVLAAGAQQQVNIDTGGDPDSRLELRNYMLPDGTTVTFYVLTGNPVTITVGEQELRANHVEIDLQRQELRVIGHGTFISGSETVEGMDLVIDLSGETFSARQVLVITGAVDVVGAEAYRVPGQISFTDGSFSPCSRCGQQVEDFGFRAERLELFPGDRLVAFEVTMLIRGREFLHLPLMVVPLAAPQRQPRLLIAQGTETERAQVALDWPYVSGPNSYGTFSIRYHADVDPAGTGLARRLLGGAIETQYLGGGLSHLWYTDVGAGTFDFMYVPSFLDASHPAGRQLAQFNFRYSYATVDDALPEGAPRAEVLVERDDTRRHGLIEYRALLLQPSDPVMVRVFTQGFFDLIAGDSVIDPSWFGRRDPRRTLFELGISPLDDSPIVLGVLRLSRLRLEGGIFEDATNPALRSVSTSLLSQAARLHAGHTIEMPGVTLWPGLEISGRNVFGGWYYSSGQRLIDWSTRGVATQQFGEWGRLSLTFTRELTEGETPFRFDQLPLRERTDATAELRVVPARWLTLSASTGYVFTDSRNPRAEGWQPLTATATLFDNVSWLSLVLRNQRDLETGDPGNLDVELTLRQSGRGLNASLGVSYIHDLDPEFSRDGAVPENDTSTALAATLSWENVRIEFGWGYNFEPSVPDNPDEPLRYWEPFELDVMLGSMRSGDDTPGFRVSWARDLNYDRPSEFEYEGRFMLGRLEISALQRFRLPQGGLERSRLRVSYPGYLQFEATGVMLLQPEWVWLPADEDQARTVTLALTDAPLRGPQQWQVRYATTLDPRMTTLAGGTGGRRNTTLELRALLEQERVGDGFFSVDLFVDLPLRDDALARSYLRRATVSLGMDWGGRVGLQGSLGYRGTYSAALEEVTRGELALNNVALTVRVLDDLYVGAVLNDVWDLTGNSTTMARFNFQPEFLVMWNRCCWALYGSWNSATGQVRIALTTPGASTGITEVFNTPLLLPGRHGDTGGAP